MLQDYKLGIRMLVKYPGLTVAGGLALAIAIGIGAGWYDFAGKVLFPTLPLPEGDRIVAVDTRNVLTNRPELRVSHDFLEWRRELRTITELGAFRTAPRNLTVGRGAPQRIQMAELTATAFRAAHVAPLLGRLLLESDETPGAPGVVVLGYDVWQRALAAGQDVIGSEVTVGDTAATVVGVMPDGFGYPFNYQAWMPLQLRASYGALEGGAISVIGRLVPGVTRAQADAELRALGERTALALPATHEHLRPRIAPLGEPGDPDNDMGVSDVVAFAITNLPALLVLMVACMSVGTLVYARTATREGEIALRSALGASRSRIVGQLFVETLALVSLAALVGLAAADWTERWGIEGAYTDEGGIPFWITPGLSPATIVYSVGLAMTTAAMLSLLPALRVTRARVQTHLANLGSGGGTLRFGRLWTAAMIAQVALTAIGIPVAMESASQVARQDSVRSKFPSHNYLAARIDIDVPFEASQTSPSGERRGRLLAEVERRVSQEPGVIAVTFADRAPGGMPSRSRTATIQSSEGAGAALEYRFATSSVGPGYFEAFESPIVAGRAFNAGDLNSAARSVIVNEAFVRGFVERGGRGSAIGARVQYADRPADTWFEIIGIVRDLGLDLTDEGIEVPQVFHTATVDTLSPLMMNVRMRAHPAPLIARLPTIASSIDADAYIPEAQALDEWILQRTSGARVAVVLGAGVTLLTLFLSALGIFSLMSVSVSRRTREIGLRAALGANPRRVLARLLSSAAVLMGSGVGFGGAFLLLQVALMGEDVPRFTMWLAATSAVMLVAGLLACIVPARRALKINPIDALREI